MSKIARANINAANAPRQSAAGHCARLDTQRREQYRADRADRGGFGRRRKSDQDRAEHDDDQQHRRDHRLEHLANRPSVSLDCGIGGTAAGRTIATATRNRR